MPARATAALLLSAALSLGLAACGDDETSAPDTTTTVAATTTTSGGTTTTGAPAEPATVAVSETDIGEVLVNGEGLTLYVFDNDSDGSPTCTGACAGAWPPLLVDGEITAEEGLDATLFATVPNPDGGNQLTVQTRPLYLYSGDSAAGQTNGDGVGGIWHAVGADGTAL